MVMVVVVEGGDKRIVRVVIVAVVVDVEENRMIKQ
jgi:hypothetical protein